MRSPRLIFANERTVTDIRKVIVMHPRRHSEGYRLHPEPARRGASRSIPLVARISERTRDCVAQPPSAVQRFRKSIPFGQNIRLSVHTTRSHMPKYLIAVLLSFTAVAFAQKSPDYKLLATSRTSTMEKEINQMARDGYRLVGTMGGDTHEGEIIVTMRKLAKGDDEDRFQYKLLATSRTGTMERELQEAADQGYEYA